MSHTPAATALRSNDRTPVELCVATEHCRICGAAELATVIDLGDQHIAGIFMDGDPSAALSRRYPLEVVRCAANGGCGLVQLRHSIAPDVLYDNYGYRSGTNELMRENLAGIVRQVEELVMLKSGDVVVDVGCNDGTLMEFYKTPGIRRVGFDPAPNVAAAARAKGLHVVNDFFSAEAFRTQLPTDKARVVTSIAMFYDLEEPCRFVSDVASILADDGVWVIELSYLPSMLSQNSYDTICHEHLEYYALRQIEWMLERERLHVVKVELTPANGGSFRLFVSRDQQLRSNEDLKSLESMRGAEQVLGLDSDQPYQVFRHKTSQLRAALVDLLADLKERGKTVYVYGASTKGNTILQYCGIGPDLVTKAADRNPEKWGRHTLGTDIPIVSEERARAEAPDYFLVLPWHFISGFLTREKDFLARGGRFIMPLPTVQVIGKEHELAIGV